MWFEGRVNENLEMAFCNINGSQQNQLGRQHFLQVTVA
jgi:hypothetical protein